MTNASTETGIAPSKIISMFNEFKPRLINHPKPFAPAKAAIVTVPTDDTAAILIPAIMNGTAIGSSTFIRL